MVYVKAKINDALESIFHYNEFRICSKFWRADINMG